MFIFNGYAIMTVRKFVDSRKEMRMENQKEKSTKKRRVLKFRKASYKKCSYRSCSGFGNRTWGNWTAQCNHIGKQDYENRI